MQPAEQREPNQLLIGPLPTFPKKFDVAAEAIAKQDVDRSVADDLVGDIGVAHGDVSGLGSLHTWLQSVSPPSALSPEGRGDSVLPPDATPVAIKPCAQSAGGKQFRQALASSG